MDSQRAGYKRNKTALKRTMRGMSLIFKLLFCMFCVCTQECICMFWVTCNQLFFLPFVISSLVFLRLWCNWLASKQFYIRVWGASRTWFYQFAPLWMTVDRVTCSIPKVVLSPYLPNQMHACMLCLPIQKRTTGKPHISNFSIQFSCQQSTI